MSTAEDYVTLDWDDISLGIWARFRVHRLVEAHDLGWLVRDVWYRRSSNGRCHILVRLRRSVSTDTRLIIRSQLGDDRARLAWDMQRAFLPESLVDYSRGVLFDRKGGKEAGPWLKIV